MASCDEDCQGRLGVGLLHDGFWVAPAPCSDLLRSISTTVCETFSISPEPTLFRCTQIPLQHKGFETMPSTSQPRIAFPAGGCAVRKRHSLEGAPRHSSYQTTQHPNFLAVNARVQYLLYIVHQILLLTTCKDYVANLRCAGQGIFFFSPFG